MQNAPALQPDGPSAGALRPPQHKLDAQLLPPLLPEAPSQRSPAPTPALGRALCCPACLCSFPALSPTRALSAFAAPRPPVLMVKHLKGMSRACWPPPSDPLT